MPSSLSRVHRSSIDRRVLKLTAAAGACAALLARPLPAQQRVVAPRATPFTIDVGVYQQSLDNGYGDWRGSDLRVGYSGDRVAPFATASTQTRREGQQASYGLGSYLILSPRVYTIVDFSVATGGGAVLFPRLRWDATLVSDPGLLTGLVIVTGYTHVSFGGGSASSIASAGPIYYHGPMILSGLAHVNHDEAGGATTGSGEIAGQFGREGTAWTGASLSAGHEAYLVVGATPFDAQFTNVSGSIFHQRWITKSQSILGRLEYQDKRTAYHRRGVTLGYRVAF